MQPSPVNNLFNYVIGCPCVVRADSGTENTMIAMVQFAFRMHSSSHLPGRNAFMYGSSPANQVSDSGNS